MITGAFGTILHALCDPVYVPALKAFSQWFKAKNFSTMTGLLLAVGNLGAIVATTPLAWMAGAWGWRTTFLAMGAVTFALAFAVLIGIRDLSPDEAPLSETLETRPAMAGHREDSTGHGCSSLQIRRGIIVWDKGPLGPSYAMSRCRS